jgi:hypothetical protein
MSSYVHVEIMHEFYMNFSGDSESLLRFSVYDQKLWNRFY